MANGSSPQLPLIAASGDERTLLTQFLDHYRCVLLRKTHALSASQLNTAIAPSTLTLGGLLNHMALVEEHWFVDCFSGARVSSYFEKLDWDNEPDAELNEAKLVSYEELARRFELACNSSRLVVAQAHTFDELSHKPGHDGECRSLRWIMIHMIEEYARHCGHGDLIRESIDGVRGN